MLHDKGNRLLAIASDLANDYELRVEGRKRLDVAVRGAILYGLSFVYYKYTGPEKQDEWRALGGPLNSDWHSNSAIDALNRFFMPQANIEFGKLSVRDWEDGPDYHPTWHMRDGQFYDIKLTELAHSEGITVFVVPEIGDNDANAFSDDARSVPGLKGHVTWAPWHVQPEKLKYLANPKADPFIARLGHELVHDLAKNRNDRAVHSDRAYVMCNSHLHSKIDEEYLIDKVTLDRINPRTS